MSNPAVLHKILTIREQEKNDAQIGTNFSSKVF